MKNESNRRGEPFDDLLQVAYLGMLKAVERFDPERNLEFSTFATATVEGELKRHFRDRTWTMKVPRGLKDDYATVNAAVARLSATLGRTPTVAEIAEECEATTERVLAAFSSITLTSIECVGGRYRHVTPLNATQRHVLVLLKLSDDLYERLASPSTNSNFVLHLRE